MNWTDLFFSSTGRVGRKGWWLGVLGLVLWNFIVFYLLWTIFSDGMFRSFLGRLVTLPFNLLTIYVTYNLAVKRFNDRGRSPLGAQAVAGFWGFRSLLELVGITGDPWQQNSLDTIFLVIGTAIGLWYFIELGCMRGTVGPNPHGEDPVPAT